MWRSPYQVLTHAARAAAKQLPLVAARGAREGLWLEQRVAFKPKAQRLWIVAKRCLACRVQRGPLGDGRFGCNVDCSLHNSFKSFWDVAETWAAAGCELPITI